MLELGRMCTSLVFRNFSIFSVTGMVDC